MPVAHKTNKTGIFFELSARNCVKYTFYKIASPTHQFRKTVAILRNYYSPKKGQPAAIRNKPFVLYAPRPRSRCILMRSPLRGGAALVQRALRNAFLREYHCIKIMWEISGHYVNIIRNKCDDFVKFMCPLREWDILSNHRINVPHLQHHQLCSSCRLLPFPRFRKRLQAD